MSKETYVVTGRNTPSACEHLKRDHISVNLVHFGKGFSVGGFDFGKFAVRDPKSLYSDYAANDGFYFAVNFVHYSPSFRSSVASSLIFPFLEA